MFFWRAKHDLKKVVVDREREGCTTNMLFSPQSLSFAGPEMIIGRSDIYTDGGKMPAHSRELLFS